VSNGKGDEVEIGKVEASSSKTEAGRGKAQAQSWGIPAGRSFGDTC
jgi:hypothetical protein